MVEKITKWAYLDPLLFRSEFIHLAEISKKIGKNHSVVRQYMDYFEKQGILKKQKVGKMSMFKLNENNPLILQIIYLVEKERIINLSSELILKEFVGFANKLEFSQIILFGSFVQNSKKAKDADLLVIGESKKINFEEIEKKINKKIHLIHLKNLEEISPALKEEIKSKHLIIKGVEEVVKWLI